MSDTTNGGGSMSDDKAASVNQDGRGYSATLCCVPWCEEPRLGCAWTCYGHTVDPDDPRWLPTHIDGEAHSGAGLRPNPGGHRYGR